MRLYHPRETAKLYPAPAAWAAQRRWPSAPDATSNASAPPPPPSSLSGDADDDGHAAARQPRGTISLVDVAAPDSGRFPLFATASFSEVLLRPGDCLYIPAGTWHWVRSLDASASVSFVL